MLEMKLGEGQVNLEGLLDLKVQCVVMSMEMEVPMVTRSLNRGRVVSWRVERQDLFRKTCLPVGKYTAQVHGVALQEADWPVTQILYVKD